MWIEIFKTGTQTDSTGKSRDFTAENLDEIAAMYNENISGDESCIAPVVKGHPKDNEPAYGWVERLARRGKKLLAKLKELDSEFLQEVKKGAFRKISMAIYPDGMLRHVGFLGAVAPAVKGLKPVKFSDTENFSEFVSESEIKEESEEPAAELNRKIEELNADKASLSEELSRLKQQIEEKEFADFAESLIHSPNGPKIRHFQKDTVVRLLRFASDMDGSKESSDDFSESKTTLSEVKEFLSALPPIAHLNPLQTKSSKNLVNANFSERNVSEERLALHDKALRLMNSDRNLSYEDAVNIANKNDYSQIF